MPHGDAHALGSGGGARAPRIPGPPKGRKHNRRSGFFRIARRRPFGPLPPVSLSPPPASRAKPLILRQELHLWPRHTDAATCNLTVSACLSGARTLGEAGRVGIVVCSLRAEWIWDLTPRRTSFKCIMGVITVLTALGGAEVSVMFSTQCVLIREGGNPCV